MALLVRVDQTAKFVHAADPAAVKPAEGEPWPCSDPDWLPAKGQPADCTVFEVRALSHAEFAAANDALRDGDGEKARAIQLAALKSIGGDPADLAGLAFGWDTAIANLIVSQTLNPLSGRILRSATATSTVPTAGG